jgi:lipid A 3-O-deacylase
MDKLWLKNIINFIIIPVRMTKRALLFIFLGTLLALSLKGQADYTRETGIVSDNDAYLMLALDQYYTNGLILYFRYVPKEFSEKLYNKIIEFRIGQKIYNPFQGYVPWIERMDKPFAGYFFVETGISRFYKNESMLKTNLQIGVLGPSSHAEEVQLFYHRAFNLYGIDGWQYQVHDAAGLNLDLTYLKSIRYFFNKQIDISIYSELRAGTINDDVSAGVLTRASIYKLHPLYNSNYTGSAISRNKDISSEKELFLYFKPQLSYIFYDATIQGGIFSESSPVTFDVRPLLLQLELGISGSYKNLNAGYSVIFHTKDAKNNLVKDHIYASIYLAYRF